MIPNSMDANTTFYISYGSSVVRLNHIQNGSSGIFRCSIPDADGETRNIFIGVYTNKTGTIDKKLTTISLSNATNLAVCQ